MVDASPVDFSLRRMFGDPLKCRGLTPIWFRNAEARLLAVFRKVLATIPRRSAPGVPFGGPVEVEKGPDKDVPFVVGWQSDEGLSDVPAVATVITPPAPGSVVRLIAAFFLPSNMTRRLAALAWPKILSLPAAVRLRSSSEPVRDTYRGIGRLVRCSPACPTRSGVPFLSSRLRRKITNRRRRSAPP